MKAGHGLESRKSHRERQTERGGKGVQKVCLCVCVCAHASVCVCVCPYLGSVCTVIGHYATVTACCERSGAERTRNGA